MRSEGVWTIQEKVNFKTNFYLSQIKDTPLPLGLAIEDQLILGFSLPPQAATLHFSCKPLNRLKNTEILFLKFADISFVEATGFLQSPFFKEIFVEDLFFEKLQQGRSVRLLQLAPIVSELSIELKKWLLEKKVKASELSALSVLKSSPSLFDFLKSEPVAKFFTSLNPSKSEGIQIIEWIVDLLLIDSNNFERVNLILSKPLKQALIEFRNLRYPQATQQDLKNKEFKLSWPSSVQNKFARKGDRSGFDIHFFVSNPSELKKTIQNFERVFEEWNNSSLKS